MAFSIRDKFKGFKSNYKWPECVPKNLKREADIATFAPIVLCQSTGTLLSGTVLSPCTENRYHCLYDGESKDAHAQINKQQRCPTCGADFYEKSKRYDAEVEKNTHNFIEEEYQKFKEKLPIICAISLEETKNPVVTCKTQMHGFVDVSQAGQVDHCCGGCGRKSKPAEDLRVHPFLKWAMERYCSERDGDDVFQRHVVDETYEEEPTLKTRLEGLYRAGVSGLKILAVVVVVIGLVILGRYLLKLYQNHRPLIR